MVALTGEMAVPLIKRVNTIGVKYTKGEFRESQLGEIIENILEIAEGEVAGISVMGKFRFMIKVSTFERYNEIGENYVGQVVSIDESCEIRIEDVSSYKNRVRMKFVPFELNNDALRMLLERFGKVENVVSCYRRQGKYKGVPTDERIAWMIVEHPIPSSLFVKDTQTYIHFSYEKQPITCHKCGSLAHLADKCNIFKDVRPQNRENAIDIQEFPYLNGTVSTGSESRSSLSSDLDESQPAIGAPEAVPVEAQAVPGEAQAVPGEAHEVSNVEKVSVIAKTVENSSECDFRSDSDENMQIHTGESLKKPHSASKNFSYADSIKSPGKSEPPVARKRNKTQDIPSSSQSTICNYDRIGSVANKRALSLSPTNDFELVREGQSKNLKFA